MNNIREYDVTDIGSVYFTLNFDEDWYEEYLLDNGLQDTEKNKYEYIKDNCDYDVEFTDSETYHHLGYDTMTIDEIEDFFGEMMANEVFKDCMDEEQHEYEPYNYISQSVDITDPNELSQIAIKCLQHGEYFKNARGFILPNGIVVYTDQEHNMCSKIPGIKGTFHFIELGCIRVLPNGIDLSKKPTNEQYKTLYKVLKCYYSEELYLDLMNKQIGNFSKKYQYCDPDEIINDINKYFKGIMRNNKIYETMKVISLDENKIRKIVSETLKRALKKRLNESSFLDQEEYTVEDFISDFKEMREMMISENDGELYSIFSSLESEWTQNQEDMERYGESIDNSYFSQFKNFKDYCQEWISGVLSEKYSKQK